MIEKDYHSKAEALHDILTPIIIWKDDTWMLKEFGHK